MSHSQLSVRKVHIQFYEQPQTFQTQAGFPDVFNSQQQPSQLARFSQQQEKPFQTPFSQQQLPFQAPQDQSPPQPNRFNGAQQSYLQPLSSGPGSGRSLFDQIVKNINSGHRQKSQRKQGSIQQQQRPQNLFSDPTFSFKVIYKPTKSAAFPAVNSNIPKLSAPFF